jgi:uncharacterized protein
MIRLLTIAAALFAFVSSAHAEPPVCTGTDLYAKLQRDDPKAFAEIEAEAAKVKNGHSIFWKIERDGLEPSWLFGTAHVTDPRVTTLTPAVESAFESASTVALELTEIRDQQEMAVAAMRNARFMVMPDGKSLWDIIPDDQESLIRDHPNLQGGPGQMIFGYQPWVVATMISVPLCETERELQGLKPLDMMLAQRAEQQGSSLVGLETVEEQLSIFASMPLDMQAQYLLSSAKAAALLPDSVETLIRLYAAQHVTAFMPLMLKIMPAEKGQENFIAFFEQDLISKRNHVMQARALSLLSEGDLFIAVGAMHLPGDEGLVELIMQAGYKVTPVH